MWLSIPILAVNNLTQSCLLFAQSDASYNISRSLRNKGNGFYTVASNHVTSTKYQSGPPIDSTEVSLQMEVGVYHHTGISTISLPYVSAYTQPLE